jgi:serine phosphatase RsbU (regulator of sigma subunit)
MELNIKKTLTIFICAIVIATAIALTLVSLFSQKKEINLSIEEKLQIIQSEKIKILKDIERDNTLKILNLSKNVIITDAFNGFQKAYNEIPKNPDNKKLNSIINAIHEKLETSAGFKSLDQAHKGDVNTFLPEDPTSLCLQATYVFKLKECSYPQSLDAYNKWFKEFIEDNKFYDLFLIDPKTGNILYTAEKEVDFANNINRSYFDNTGLKEAYRGALNAPEGKAIFSDYKFYKPSLLKPAAFIATPIYKNNQLYAVLALQLSSEVLYSSISNNFKWKETGLGNTGETLLIGPDGFIRNVSRLSKENYQGYLDFIKKNNFSTDVINLYQLIQVNSLIQNSNTKAFDEANKGNKGSSRYKNYLGKDVIGHYDPINFGGLKYVLVTEIEAQEAFRGYESNKYNTATTASIIVIIIAIITYFLSRFLTQPIVNLANIANDFSENKEKKVTKFKSFIKEINFLFKEFSSMQDKIIEDIKVINQSKAAAEQSAKILQKEVKQANEVQSLLFPSRDQFNFITGFSKPARDLSGDLFDYFEIWPNDTAFILADISGKGISASLLMSQVIAIFRNQIKQSPDLASAAKAINETLLGSNSKRFLTFVGGIYSRATGDLTILNCGHLPVMIMDKDGVIEKIETETFPLGIQELESKDLIIKSLNIKDKSMYCFTDGLLEASYNNRVFDENAFSVDIFIKKLNLLPFNQRISFVEKEYNSKNLQTKDDLTILIIKN